MSATIGLESVDAGDDADLDGYVATDVDTALFLQWTRTGDDVRGTVSFAGLSGSDVRHDSGSFDGVVAESRSR